jgi:hypothetical protein
LKNIKDTLIMVMTYWDKHIAQIAHLGEKVIQLDSWKEDKITQMLDNYNRSWKRKRRPWRSSK